MKFIKIIYDYIAITWQGGLGTWPGCGSPPRAGAAPPAACGCPASMPPATSPPAAAAARRLRPGAPGTRCPDSWPAIARPRRPPLSPASGPRRHRFARPPVRRPGRLVLVRGRSPQALWRRRAAAAAASRGRCHCTIDRSQWRAEGACAY